MARTKIISFVSVILMTSLACNFLTSSKFLEQKLKPSKHLYTISGTLNPAREITVPGDTRVLILWTVLSEDPGYGYIFGEGTVDFVNYSFTINFDEPPPTEAMNRLDDLNLGYGRVILTANQRWNGKLPEASFSKDEIIGIAGSYFIFYIDGKVNSVKNADWLSDFSQGYSVGREVKMSSGFDKFKLVAPNTIQLIIDDLDNIDIADWR
jgi:hypothetical protein